jgi:phosphohistidine phosphatase SixA
MRLTRQFFCAACVLIVPLLAHAQPSALPVRDLAPKELVAMLRAGGLVLYFRHASTDRSQKDEDMRNLDDCTRQRNLTNQGRDEARAIGAAVKELAIPIGVVLSSPFCRTTETAQLAFLRAEKSAGLRAGNNAQRSQALRQQLSTPPQSTTNTMLVGHGEPFFALAGAPVLREGEAAVLQPLGNGAFEIIARIRAEEWRRLTDLH